MTDTPTDTPKEETPTPKKRPPLLRVLSFTGKALLGILVILLLVLSLSLLGLMLYLNPGNAERILSEQFNSASTGTLTLSVEKFNPYRGFLIHDIEILDADKKPVLSVKKISLRYRLFRLFTGDLLVPELQVISPKVFLVEREGVWNVATLFPKEEKTEEEEKPEEPTEEEAAPEEPEEPEKEEKPAEDIQLPIAVEALLKMELKDIEVSVDAEDYKASMKGLTILHDLRVPPTKTIPAGVEAIKILETLRLQINPDETLEVRFASTDAALQPPLLFTWLLEYDMQEDKRLFNSSFKLGTYKTPVRFKRTHLAPLNFLVSYDMNYNPLQDILTLQSLRVTFSNDTWIDLQGTVSRIMETPRINISMRSSLINLTALFPYYRALTGDRSTFFRGTVSLFPLTVQGTPENLKIAGSLGIRSLRYDAGAIAAIVPKLDLAYTVAMVGKTMHLTTSLKVPQFFYRLDGEASGMNSLSLDADITGYNSFQRIALNSIDLRHGTNYATSRDLHLKMNGSLVKGDKGMKANISLPLLMVYVPVLSETVPDSIKKSLKGIPLKKPVTGRINLNATTGDTVTAATTSLRFAIPDFDLPDLGLTTSVVMNSKTNLVTLKYLKLFSNSWDLALNSQGTLSLEKEPFTDANLALNFRMNAGEGKTILEAWNLKGSIGLDATMKGNLEDGIATARIKSDKFSAINSKDKLALRNVDLNIPVEYSFKTAEAKSVMGVDASSIIESDHFGTQQNISIASIEAAHPARDIQFQYLRDFRASLSFKDNVLLIKNMKSYVLGGSLYGRDILFNLADMKPRNMEFNINLDLTKINIGLLDDIDTDAKDQRAELSLNANFSGKGLDIERELTARGYINIYEIGEKFANRLMKGLSEEEGKSKLGIGQVAVDNTMNIRGFNFLLDKGLVYTTVTLEKRILGYLFGVENDRIEFERIPIQEYLRKVSEGEEE